MPTVTSATKKDFDEQKMAQKGLIDKADQPTIAKLTEAVTNALKNHLSLSPKDRVKNSMEARERVGKWVGFQQNGQPKPLLNENVKLQKAKSGYNLDNKDQIQLPDGRGVETTGLAMAPAYQEGTFNSCPNSASCKTSCLGKTAGNYFQLGGGNDLSALKGPRKSGFDRMQAFLRDPAAFAVRLHDEIKIKKMLAEDEGNKLGVRLNVISDIHPKVFKALMEAHPDVQFYDYTKNNTLPVADNHHLTYSSTGVTQPAGANGMTESVTNPHQNWHHMRKMLESGKNVAMAFNNNRTLPKEIHDVETGMRYKVVDGDQHDFRPLDGTDEKGKGQIIGLKRKSAATNDKKATKDSNGFFVHYDPQYLRDEKGRQVRDPNDPTGKSSIPTVTSVDIHPQPRRTILLDNDGKQSKIPS